MRQVGYEGASCVSGWGDPDGVIRMVCVLRVTMRCVARVLRRRGPYNAPLFNLPILLEQKMGGLKIIDFFETEVVFLSG